MEKPLSILCCAFGLGVALLIPSQGAAAVLVGLLFTLGVITVIKQYKEESSFLLQVFLAALLLRMTLAVATYIFQLEPFFGGDSLDYDKYGYELLQVWLGQAEAGEFLKQVIITANGWGMYYLVAALYFFVGQNPLAGQFISCVAGAATVPAIYLCSYRIFHNRRAAKLAAIIVAVCPSLIIWSSQLLKDGYIIFLLVMTMLAVLQLQKKFSYIFLGVLIFSLFAIISLRFYVFYILATAVVGSFLIGVSNSPQAIARRLVTIVIVGVGLTYLGVLQNADVQVDRFNLEQLQASHAYAAGTAESGFSKDIDISTPEGAISAIPIGFIYLMLAPFPWQITNFRQAVTLPEMLIWWASIPILIGGLWYTIRYKFRSATVILLFTLMLTIAYSLYQGNVGTAYRQRAQIQVFLFIFVGVGWTILQERRENQQLLQANRQRRLK